MPKQRRLTWEDPDNPIGTVVQYNIKYGTTQGGPYQNVIPCPVSSGVSRTIDLTPGLYYFVVTAENLDGESPASNEVSMIVSNAPVRVLNLTIEVVS
jgi:hypothetical protein